MNYNVGLFDIVWLLFLVFSVTPAWKRWRLQLARVRQIRDIERKRGSRVIVMIHRQEALSLLGIPLARYIDIEDSESVLRAIRLTPNDLPIDIILHTPGGLVLAVEQIAHALSKHPARVTVMVPHYAMSGGTMMALAADEIIMDENAVLGPVDPQIGQWPAASILSVVARKPIQNVSDETLILADVSRKAVEQVEWNMRQHLSRHMDEARARVISRTMTEGRWTHDYPLMVEELEALGIAVSTALPREIYELMELFPQPSPRRPSVQYIPVPYDGGGHGNQTNDRYRG